MLERIFGPLARRWGWAATALRVQERFGDVRGTYLASAVTLNLFLSIFPLLLVSIAVVGFITTNNTRVADEIIENLGLQGEAANAMNDALNRASETKRAASVIGLIGLLWSGLGVSAAIGYAIDSTWQTAGRGIKDRFRGIAWGLGALILLGVSVGLTAAADFVAGGVILSIATLIISLFVNIGFWMWTFIVLAYHRLGWKAYLPGAVFAAIGLELIKWLVSLIPGIVGNATALYGSIGTVFAIIATLALFGRLLVYASTLNVVRWEEDRGTVTVDIEVPKVPGQVPLEADRAGAVEPIDPE